MFKLLNVTITLVILLTISSIISYPVQAEFEGNVKECVENPGKCNEDSLQIESEPKSSPKSTSTTGVSFLDYVKMLFALVFVIALIYGLLKLINQKSRSFQQSKLIHNLGGTPLGGSRSVQVIKVGTRILVLGVGEDIQLLKEIENENEKDEILSFYNEKNNQLLNQKDLFTKWLGPKKQNSSHQSFNSLLSKQINELRNGRKQLMKEFEEKENRSNE
ncbi:flagellar protein FliO/FliZ [Bacillus pakistanensis]|uniref:Flagellar protein FliO/FliZ n=1 Tax=Rossellomorea pakistanensis TaxID=992288 RepID=A0ABS2NG79_9BACI|nr:flagellar biosynthetic protein FliO [Bacillus pakistanensis]MBM7586844.1 flagellar protein FliO/FliZ [Bacillus pakistanensis]